MSTGQSSVVTEPVDPTTRHTGGIGSRPAALVAAAATLGLAAVSWAVAARAMSGMDMGVATALGPLPSFVAVWAVMMAAMMLPGLVPALSRRAGAGGLGAASRFVGTYLAVWATVGVAVHVVYRPHGTVAAGLVTLAAGAYGLTPLKHRFRRQCRDDLGSGLRFGLDCVGSSLGLMLVFVALGVMSMTWMAVASVLAVAQKLLPARAIVDVPLGLAVVGLGVLVLVEPSAVPGLVAMR